MRQCALRSVFSLRVFFHGLINNSGILFGGAVLFWDVRIYTGRVSEWLPWAPSRTRHRVSCSGQLCSSSNAQLFSPWPVLQNIVCTSVILPPPWASQRPPLLLPSPLFLFFFFFLSLVFISAVLLVFCSSFSSSRHWLFFLHTKI